MPSVRQIVQVKRSLGDRLNVLCCDYPGYSVVLPTLAAGGDGTANIGGNVIPEEMALIWRLWSTHELMVESRSLHFEYYPLLEALEWFSNPIVIKSVLRILGLSSGGMRRPYREFEGERLAHLRQIVEDTGVISKDGQG